MQTPIVQKQEFLDAMRTTLTLSKSTKTLPFQLTSRTTWVRSLNLEGPGCCGFDEDSHITRSVEAYGMATFKAMHVGYQSESLFLVSNDAENICCTEAASRHLPYNCTFFRKPLPYYGSFEDMVGDFFDQMVERHSVGELSRDAVDDILSAIVTDARRFQLAFNDGCRFMWDDICTASWLVLDS